MAERQRSAAGSRTGKKRRVSGSEGLHQRLDAPLASFLKLFPFIGVLFCPLQDRVDDPIPGLRTLRVVYQDAVNYHFNPILSVQAIISYSAYLLIRSGR